MVLTTLSAYRAAGLAATSVNFGPFAEVGMAAAHTASMRGMGLQGLPPQQVSDAFLQAGYAPRHVSARLLLSQFTKVNTAKSKWALLDDLLTTSATALPIPAPQPIPAEHTTSTSAMVAASLAGEGVQVPQMAVADIEQVVRRTAAEILGEELSGDGRFASSHIDSLAAVELSNSIGKAVGLDLPGTLVFDYPSVAEVAKHLSARLAAQSNNDESHPRDRALIAVQSPSMSIPHGLLTQRAMDPQSANSMLMGIKLAHRISFDRAASQLTNPGGQAICRDTINRVPYDRWDLEAPRAGKAVLRAGFGAFVGDVGVFDAGLFGITGPEADLMDPQQRLLLEASWEVMAPSNVSMGPADSAGAMPGSMHADAARANMGVWIGIQQMEYGNLAAAHLPTMGAFSATGMPFSVAAGRISFTYGLKGPAVRPLFVCLTPRTHVECSAPGCS